MAVRTNGTARTLQTKIWQWNCRSIRRKISDLLELAKQDQPDVIALQETYSTNIRLQEYNAFNGSKRTAVMTKKTLTAQEHEITVTNVEQTLVEILPDKKTEPSLYILSVYSPPRDQLMDFEHFIRKIKNLTKGHKVVIVGDFNAPHSVWGYPSSTKKGTRIHDAAQSHHLTLWNDVLQPTRVGNSVSRDTNPDLTLTHGIPQAEWTRLEETLGSDHHILQLEITHRKRTVRTGTAKLTDWKSFREDLTPRNIEEIDKWLSDVLEKAEKHTILVQLNSDTPVIEPHLFHLWEARRGLLKWWKRQKHNRKLKMKIATIPKQAGTKHVTNFRAP